MLVAGTLHRLTPPCPCCGGGGGRDVVVGVNTYKKDRDLLLAENEEVLIRAILDEVSAVREGDHWAYSLMFP